MQYQQGKTNKYAYMYVHNHSDHNMLLGKNNQYDVIIFDKGRYIPTASHIVHTFIY